jgi:hypothetical protein
VNTQLTILSSVRKKNIKQPLHFQAFRFPQITDFLKESGLPLTLLHEIWGEVDEEGTGLLSKQQFFMVLRIIGHAQKGRDITGGSAYVEPADMATFGQGRGG